MAKQTFKSPKVTKPANLRSQICACDCGSQSGAGGGSGKPAARAATKKA